jgi:hypothetical protein
VAPGWGTLVFRLPRRDVGLAGTARREGDFSALRHSQFAYLAAAVWFSGVRLMSASVSFTKSLDSS